MSSTKGAFLVPTWQSPLTATLLSVVLIAAIVLVDLLTPVNVVVPILYGVPLVLHLWVRKPRWLWGLALVLVVLTLGLSWWGPAATVPVPRAVFLNRVMSALATLMLAAVLHLWMRTAREVEAKHRALEKQNKELEAVNQELERQREELRAANEELAGRQKAVGQLLEQQQQLQQELDRRRQEAEEASARKTRFLAAVSHDIRTPTNAINLMAEVIGRMAATPAMAGQIPEMARKLRANALSLMGLVSEVLDIARFDSGKVDLQESDFSLGDLIQHECRQLVPLAEEKHLALTIHPPAQPVRVRTDRVKLLRVLNNLIGNAIKFTDAGEVEVSLALTPENQVVIRVRDTGVGIAAEHLTSIFDEFVQLRHPARDRGQGTGLGLAISKRLIEVMGGTIAVESTPGQGSTFTVTLPSTRVLSGA